MKISIIGLGFVGNAMYESFSNKTNELKLDYTIYGYDKYKNNGIGNLLDCLNSDIIFTALPTLYDEMTCGYDNSPTHEIINQLLELGYDKTIVIKSTVEPLFTETLSNSIKSINFIHNPEFLTARTAYNDFHNQKHIVLGLSTNCSDESFNIVKQFYSSLYPDASLSICTSTESECMKIFCNSFYAVKVQYFNELYDLSSKLGANYDTIVELMIKNGWINPMHTKVPGPDGKLSFGGLCLTKDTYALLSFMKKNDTHHNILEACINERNIMRK